MYQATQQQQEEPRATKLPNDVQNNNSTDVNVNDDDDVVMDGHSAASSISEEVLLNDVVDEISKKPLARRRSSAVDAFIKQNSVRSLASTDTMTSFRTTTSRCRSVMDDDDDDTNFSALRAPTRRLSAEHVAASNNSTATATDTAKDDDNGSNKEEREGSEGVVVDSDDSASSPKISAVMDTTKKTTVSTELDDNDDDDGAHSPPSKRFSTGSNDRTSNNEGGNDGGSRNFDSVSIADISTVVTDVITNVTSKAAPTVDHDDDDNDASTFTAQNITATNSAIMSSNDDGSLVDIDVSDDNKKDNIDKEESSNSALNNKASGSSNSSDKNGNGNSGMSFLSAFSLSLQQIQASSISTIRSSLPSPNKKSNRAVDTDNFEDSPPPAPRTKTREELSALQELQQERQRVEMELLNLQMREEEEKRRLKIKEQQEEIMRQCASGDQQQICPKERDPNQRPPNSSRSQKHKSGKQLKKQQHQHQQQEVTPPSKNLEGESSSDMLLSSMFAQFQQGAWSLFKSGDDLLRNSFTSSDAANGLESIREIDEEDLDDDTSVFSRKNSLQALMQLRSFGSTSISSINSLMKQPLKESQEVVPSATATLVSETMDYKFPPASPTNSFHSQTKQVFATVLPAFFHVDEDENPSPYGTAEAPRRRKSFRGFYLARQRSEELKKKFGNSWFWIQIFVAFLFLAAIFGLVASLILVSNRVKSHNEALQSITSVAPVGANSGNNGLDFSNSNSNQSHNDNDNDHHNGQHSASSPTLSLPVIEGTWKDVAEPLNGNPRYDYMNLEYMYGHALSDDGTILALTGRTVAPSTSVDDAATLKVNGVFIRVFEQRDGFWHPVGSDISHILQNNEQLLQEDDGYFSCWSLDMNSDGTIIAFGTTTITNSTSNSNSNSNSHLTSNVSSQKRQQSVTSDDNDATGVLQKVHVYQFDGKEWNTFGSTIVVDSVSLNDAQTNSERRKQSIAISDDGQTLVVGSTIHFLRSDSGSNSNPSSRFRRHGKALNGNVRVYKYYRGGSWKQFGQTLTGFESGDQFGWDVDISANGAVIAVGATQQSFLEEKTKDESTKEEKNSPFSKAFVGNHDMMSEKKSGYACVFELDNSNNHDKTRWKIRGKDLFGIQHNDKFGYSLSLSKDGNTLAVGAPHSTPRQIKDHNNDLLQHPGQVYVFYYTKKQISDHKRRVLEQQSSDEDAYEWVYDGVVLSGANSYDNFGSWVDLSARGDVLVIAAHLHKNEANPYYETMNGYTQIFTRINGNDNNRHNEWYRYGNTLMSMKDISNNNNTAATTSLKNACGIIVSISADGTVISTGYHPFGSTNLKYFNSKKSY